MWFLQTQRGEERMVNIWDYANSHPRIKLMSKSGNTFIGGVIAVWDAEETDDDDDSITLEMDSGEIKSFYPDEIESIETL